jgi:hypothetical protein
MSKETITNRIDRDAIRGRRQGQSFKKKQLLWAQQPHALAALNDFGAGSEATLFHLLCDGSHGRTV